MTRQLTHVFTKMGMTPERNDAYTWVASIDDIPPGQVKVVEVNHKAIAIFHIEGRFHAIYDICPHQGGPLHEGYLKGYAVTCPWHDLAFDVRTGQSTDGGGYCVGSYEVKVENGGVYLGPRRARP